MGVHADVRLDQCASGRARGGGASANRVLIIVLLGLIAAVWATAAGIGTTPRVDGAATLLATVAAEEAERAGYGTDWLQLTSGHTQLRPMPVTNTGHMDLADPSVDRLSRPPLTPVTE